MNQQDKNCTENICAAFQILPVDDRKYLMGVADGLAIKVAMDNAWKEPVQYLQPADRPSA